MTEGSAPRLFGFVQLDLGGVLTVADGRYVVRDDGDETVLVVETLGAPAPPRRRRRRPRESAPDSGPQTLPLTRVTVVRSAHPLAGEEDATRWLDDVVDETSVDALVGESVVLLNRALHISAVAGEDPHPQSFTPGRASAVRIGFGTGEEVADGDFTTALEVDVRRGGASRRQQRTEELRPQERFAGVLGGRERLDACETLLLRARADLDAGRTREAALQLRVGLDALLVELKDALDDPAHAEDIATLESRRDEVAGAARAALLGDLNATQHDTVEELTATCERVLRRRRVLRG